MRLSKYAALAKREACCTVYRVESDGVWLGSRAAVYRAGGLPWIEGREQVQAVLSLDAKQMDKIFLQEFDCADLNDVCGMNLRDYDATELETKPVAVQAVVGGCIVSAVKARDGELIFYDNNYLQTLADVLKDSDYLEMTVRRMASGQRYIAVKDGFNMLAAIMPVRVVSDKYIADLQEFEALCVDQLFRERARAETKALEDEEQTVMEEIDDGD